MEDPPKTDLQTSPLDTLCLRLCALNGRGLDGSVNVSELKVKRVNEDRMHNEVRLSELRGREAKRPRGREAAFLPKDMQVNNLFCKNIAQEVIYFKLYLHSFTPSNNI